MKTYRERLDSYANVWCHNNNSLLRPERLALLGFYYTGYEDKIKCAYCSLTLQRFISAKHTFDPLIDHKRISPECNFIYENLIVPANYVNTQQINREDQQLLNMNLAKMEDRLKTFQQWPASLQHLSFEMCLNGLYYSNVGDVAVCYVCGERIKDWWPHHSPWQRHYEQNNKCPFIAINWQQQHKTQYDDNNVVLLNKTSCADKPIILSSAPQLNVILHESHWRLPQCVACRSDFIQCVLLPCYHLCVCSGCAVIVVECPVCEMYVSGTLKINIPVKQLSTLEV
ncbi:IAP-5 [Mocis latipes granulovirus]|uniref:IAP-5 n=1 Tax=Mocis latipes granulovirus TaxID=2072024 RepID=A0A161CD50_9BBAC|nr:IAP-5 [Mocis latipes granulovirus]AKR17461.1 IAP-5 [Mocis latipes granulovirus]